MLNPKNLKTTPNLLKMFWALVLIFYAVFLVLSNAIVIIFGILYGIEYAAFIILIEIIVNLLFIGYYFKNRKSIKKQFYLMIFLAIFAAIVFVFLAMLTKIFIAI